MISVIIPVYNIELYIERCIDSILNQKYEDFELLLVDDGSTDNSGIICDRYAKKDNRIRVFHKENGGVSSARNLALNNINGEYISCIDGDDWIREDLFADFMAEREKHDIDVFMYEYYINYSDKIIEHKVAKESYGILNTEDALIHNITPDNRFLWSKIFAKRLIQGDRFDESIILGEDTLFITSVMTRAKRVLYTDKAYYYYDQRENSAVRSGFNERKLTGIVAYRDQIELCNTRGFLIARDYARGAYTELALGLARQVIEDEKYNIDKKKDTLKFIKKCVKEETPYVVKSKYLSKIIKAKALISMFSVRLVCFLCRAMGKNNGK